MSMKNLILALITLYYQNLAAGPMEEMRSRQEAHAALANLQCQTLGVPKDEGLIMDISCDLTCLGKEKKSIVVKEDFLPRKLGLKQGNGSSESNIIWASLGLTLKRWSDEICLGKANEVCGGYEKVAESNVALLSSGDWNLRKFPGCKESQRTLSPFDETSNSKRIEGVPLKILSKSFDGFSSIQNDEIDSTSPGSLKKVVSDVVKSISVSKGDCAHPIRANICYGDCVDLQVETSMVETLGTSQPLGEDVEKICGDHLHSYLKNKNYSPQLKKKFCEEFFWIVYTNQHGIGKSNKMTSTCAALRGDIDCSSLLD